MKLSGEETPLEALLSRALRGMGYDLIALERAGRGLLRVYIDKDSGVNVEDCALVSEQLTRLFAVENIDYDRLEVSSPGLDRPLTRLEDFRRFQGEQARIKLRVPRNGRRNFTGRLSGAQASAIALEIDGGAIVNFELSEIDKARLVPRF